MMFVSMVFPGPQAAVAVPHHEQFDDERVTGLAADVRHAHSFGSSIAGYVALRQLWSEWENGDPQHVERSLRELSTDAALSSELRSYARLLTAFAKRRRGDLEGAKRELAELGFLSKWLFVGPFDNDGKGGLLRVEGPEFEGRWDLAANHQGKERPVRARITPEVFPYGWVDFGALIRPQEFACVVASTWVSSKSHAKRARLSVGSAGAIRVLWNGKEVLRDPLYRSLDTDRLATEVALELEWNQVMVKLCGDDTAPLMSVRLTTTGAASDVVVSVDEQARQAYENSKGILKPEVSGKPKVSASKPGEDFAGKTANKPKSSDAKSAAIKTNMAKMAIPSSYEGPLAAILRADKNPGAGFSAAQLESMARYMQLTSGDDASEHQARELARIAAEREPTIPRLLLAGELAEDRNQREAWIAKAEARTPAKVQERISVLLARAGQARGSPNWRDSIPVYERILQIDPNNIPAIAARVELYGEAGLKETAATFLEQAVARNPRSVTLLRLLATELSEAGRGQEAKEASERYAQLRFDDSTYVRTNLEQALAKRDETSARRWSNRLLAINPDNAQSIALAARTEFAFARKAEGFALYRRALDLAPDDADTLRGLADQYALSGKTDEQVKLLKRILEVKPQEKAVREYLAQKTTTQAREDEKYAVAADTFLAMRNRASEGMNRRTLVNVQVTTVFPNGRASRFHQVVFQPLTEAAAAQGREYAFGYEGDTETVQLRGAKVYRVNGQVEEASESGESDADDPSMAMYTSQRVVYVHFPRLFPGDVVELQYRIEDVAERNAFADYFGEVHYMERNEPVFYSEYALLVPKSRNLVFNQPKIPGVTLATSETPQNRIYRYIARDLKQVDGEPYAPPASEFLGYIHTSTYRSWDDMGKWYWGLVKDQFVADDEVRKRTLEVTQGLTDEAAKVRAVYNYVVTKTRYVALEFGIHGFKPYRCAQIFARGFGDCKDKATLIVTMLKQLGIPATIVIVRTGMRGDFGTDIASLAPFDHAIAYVPSLNLYLDGTAEFTGAKELPTMDRGSLALQVNEGKAKLTRLPDPPASESVTRKVVQATVRADGSADLSWETSVSGAYASSWRRRYGAEGTRKNRVGEDLASEVPGLEVTKVTTNDLQNLDQDVSVKALAKTKQLPRQEGSALALPVGPKEFLVREFGALATRKQPLRLQAQSTSISEWRYQLPSGAKVTLAPKGGQVDSPFGSATVAVTTTQENVSVVTRIVFSKSRISPEEYPAFRKFCEQVDVLIGQRLLYTK
jgi:cellulose synthase operon protein C